MTRVLNLSFRSFAAAIAITAALSVLPAGAADLGVRGATWPIAEPDLLEQIEARLSVMQRSGELARIEREARSRARSRLEEPDAVPGIAPARETRSRLFDPSIAVERDIRLPDGALIAAAGTRVNPLARHALSRDLLFVDGRREAEIAWALNRAKPAKIVLLAGRPLDLARTHARAFFFDQGRPPRGEVRAALHAEPGRGRPARNSALPRYRSRTGTPPGSAGSRPPRLTGRGGLSASRGGRPEPRTGGLNDAEHEPRDIAGPCRARSRYPRSQERREGGLVHRSPRPRSGRTGRASPPRAPNGIASSSTGRPWSRSGRC